jgi:large subunit ribosomal protein L30
MAATLKVKLVRSQIGCSQPQRQNLRGLGLRKMHDERELEDTPAVRGMIARVSHLVVVSEGAAAVRPARPKSAKGNTPKVAKTR